MKDSECVALLQDIAPRLRMQWKGFRRVRTQVCKRLEKRIKSLKLKDVSNYRTYLDNNEQEWNTLLQLCRVTISRFYRDKLVFSQLEQIYLPLLAQQTITHGEKTLKIWSIGCASGEEPYTLSIIWKHILSEQFPGINMAISATDIDNKLLERATRGAYTFSSIKNLPIDWHTKCFEQHDELYYLHPEYKTVVEFKQQDVRKLTTDKIFNMVLCRNLVFTYFDSQLQNEALSRIWQCMAPGGILVIGVHEKLPEGNTGFIVLSEKLGVYQKVAEQVSSSR